MGLRWPVPSCAIYVLTCPLQNLRESEDARDSKVSHSLAELLAEHYL